MKPAPLLVFLPLLFPITALAARPLAKPALRADGRYQFQDQGRPAKFRIANDELQQSGPNGQKKIMISAKDHIRKVQDDAKRMSSLVAPVDLVAYEEGKPATELYRRIVTNRVSIALDEGIDPTAIGLSVNVKAMREVFYTGDYIMEFGDAAEALTAAEALQSVPGVLRCSVLLADKKNPRLIPNDPFFGGSSGAYSLTPQVDQAESRVTLPLPPLANRAFQWYLNRDASVANGTVPLLPLVSYEDNQLPVFVEPNPLKLYTKYFDGPIDINVAKLNEIRAWDLLGNDGSPIDGSGVKVAVVDDGVQINPIHADLSTIRVDTQNDYNFIDGNPALTSDPKFDNPTPPVVAGGPYFHGTGVAGLILASRNNSRGISGVAPEATVVAYRMIGANVAPDQFADGLAWGSTAIPPQVTPENPLGLRNGTEWRRGAPKFDISNNSWGNNTFGLGFFGMDPYARKAIAYGVTEGRIVNGIPRGVVYVFSAGNDGEYHGDVNSDAWVSSIYTLAIGGISDIGRRISYSTFGAALHAVAPTQGFEMAPRIQNSAGVLIPPFPPVTPANHKDRALSLSSTATGAAPWTLTPDEWDNPAAIRRSSQSILTLDVPKSTGAVAGYNEDFGGTSASAALASGVVALMLEANPNLGWRDVQEIIMRSAVVVDPMYGEWSYNPLGMPVSHKYGAGCIDATRAVQMAKVWESNGLRYGAIGALAGTVDYRECKGDPRVLPNNLNIPDNSYTTPSASKSEVSLNVPAPSPGLRIEHVVVRLKIRHGRRGDLGITLIAPATGQADAPLESYLFVPHREDYNAHIGLPDEPDSGTDRDVKEGEYWDFVSVRHWGTGGQNNALNSATPPTGGDWTLKIWDNTSQGVTDPANYAAANPQDRVRVPVANPTTSGANPVIGKVEYASVIFHGTTSPSQNESPAILDSVYLGRTAQTFQAKIRATTVSQTRAPILSYRVRVLGAITAGAPPLVVDSFGAGVGAHLKFDRATGTFTNGSVPLPKHSWTLELFATNVFGTTRRQVPLIIRDTVTYSEWKTLNFSAAQLLDPKISGDKADPDFDGVPNMLEYGMGGVPLVNDPFLLPTTNVIGTELVYDYVVDSGALTYVVRPQISSAISQTASWVDQVGVEQARSGVLRFMRLTVPIVDGTKQFVRLKIGN